MQNPWHPALQKPQFLNFFCSTATLQDGQDVLQEVEGGSIPPQAHKALGALVCSDAATHQSVQTCMQRGRCTHSACCLQDAQNILEEVYRAAPVPEEYMKYQLHLSTGMEVPQIELWFQNRRSTDGNSGAPAEGEELHCSCNNAQQGVESCDHQSCRSSVGSNWELLRQRCAAKLSAAMLGVGIRAALSASMMAQSQQ